MSKVERPRNQEMYCKPLNSSSSEDSPHRPILIRVRQKKTNDRSKIRCSNPEKEASNEPSPSSSSASSKPSRKITSSSSSQSSQCPKDETKSYAAAGSFKNTPEKNVSAKSLPLGCEVPKNSDSSNKPTPVKVSSSHVAKPSPLKESYEDKVRKMSLIANKVKHYLEPSYTISKITKEEYKKIMSKCVEKIHEESKKCMVRSDSVENLVASYVQHYIKHRKN